jgi:hypothetical protein
LKLKFFARGDALVTVPGVYPQVGQALPRVGRVQGSDGVLRATKDPFEVDADSDAGRRLIKLVRRDQSLWPADKATAEACGVEFVELEYKDDEWVVKTKKPETKSQKGSE